MRTRSLIRPNHRLAALLILLVLPIFIGSPFCSKEKNPVTPPPPPPSRKTPTELLETWFPDAYNTKDSVRYDQMLLPEFQFEFLLADAETLRARPDGGGLEPGQNYWGRTSDLRSTGAMFRSSNVGQITLDIRAQDPTPSTDCDACVEVRSEVTLSVTTDPGAADPLIFLVNSDQVFILRPDPGDSTLWVIFRQFDVER